MNQPTTDLLAVLKNLRHLKPVVIVNDEVTLLIKSSLIAFGGFRSSYTIELNDLSKINWHYINNIMSYNVKESR